jgi:hypothetical protein
VTGEPSVTDVGEPVLVRVAAIEISRGSVLAGRYQIEDVIGRGGSGIVLRAFDRVTQVVVAIKILKPDLAADPRWVERFSRELRLARQIQHANVCRVFDIGQADGHWFITMELASGGTLRDHFGEVGRRRSFEQKLEDARAVIAGLAAIHEAGVVHRDVKPDNFLRMADGRLVLSDFGLATNPSDGSMVSIMVGTPAYMAPEVVLGDQSSFRSDMWSLGVVLHEIFFNARPERAALGSKEKSEPTPSRKLVGLERTAKAFVEKCMGEDPLERPADGREAKILFERALTSRTLAVRAKSKRLLWAWPALIAVGAVAVGVGTGHWWRGATASSAVARDGRAIVQGAAPADWTTTTDVVASFEEPVHCLSWLEADRVLEVILGRQRRAVTLDVTTKALEKSLLPERAFALGCPQRSPRGELLFEAFDQAGRRQIMLAPSVERVREATAITTGLAPTWLPSGSEFVYSADDSHAAVFSLAVMTSMIVNERSNMGVLVGKAVARDGKALALRYVDPAMKWHVVVHDLPSLATSSHVLFDDLLIDVAFTGERDQSLLFSLPGPTGYVLASLALGQSQVVRRGTVPGHSLARPTIGVDRLALTDVVDRSDAWRVENGVRTVRLTTDGASYRPDLSVRGDLVVQHVGADNSSTIRLFEKGHPARSVSSGPNDYAPRFLADGSGLLYVDGTRQTIRRCDLAGTCRDVYTSPSADDLPAQPVASPDFSEIAFVTAIGRERLKVLSANGRIRDLGPARADCVPLWSDNGHDLWVLQGSEQKLSWAEIDGMTGEVLKTLPVTGELRQGENDCPVLAPPPGVFRPPGAASWSNELSVIRTASIQQVGGRGWGQKP